MRTRSTTLFCGLFLTALAAFSQDTNYVTTPPKAKEPYDLKDHIWFGGGIGLNFGTYTAIQLDPLIGYHIDKAHKLSAGVGPSYYYLKYNGSGGNGPSATGFGYRIFTRYRVIEQAFLHAEFYHLNIEGFSNEGMKRIWVPHLLIGGGYREPLGASSSLYFQILWEVLQDPNSVYRNQGPIISGGVGIGF